MLRVRASFPLLVGIILGALVPGLYLVQYAVGRARGREHRLAAELSVAVDGQEPLLLAMDLVPVGPPGELDLAGTDRLRRAAYPWNPTPIEGSLRMHLDSELLDQPTPAEHRDGWEVSYGERLAGGGPSIPRAPCTGRVLVKDARHAIPGEGLAAFDRLDLALDLQCTSPGPDGLRDSGDEQTWKVRGPVSLRTSRRG